MKRGFGLVAGTVVLAGCFTLQPALEPGPQVGDRVAFEISDLGRVSLGGTMGPELDQVAGQVLELENGEFVIGVTSVKTLRGGVQVWSGERVRIEKQYVSRMYARQFSRGRTVAFGVALAGGMTILFGKNLAVLGGGDSGIPPKPDTGIAFVPRP